MVDMELTEEQWEWLEKEMKREPTKEEIERLGRARKVFKGMKKMKKPCPVCTNEIEDSFENGCYWLFEELIHCPCCRKYYSHQNGSNPPCDRNAVEKFVFSK